MQAVQGGGIIGAARGAGLLLAVVVIIEAAQVVRVSLWACVVGAGLLLIRQGRGGAALPFAGGVRFSTLPGSALGVGLELSEL